MKRKSILLVFLTCLLKGSLVASVDRRNYESHKVYSRSTVPLKNDLTTPMSGNIDKARHSCNGEICKEAHRSQSMLYNTNRRSTARSPLLDKFELSRRRTTFTSSMRPLMATFQYDKRKPGTRAVATYSQRGFAVSCPDCLPGWQVLLSLDPAPPGRVPLSCINCPVGWETLINLTPFSNRPIVRPTTSTTKNPIFQPALGHTITSNGKNYVPLGAIIGPGGLLYVPMSSINSSLNDFKVPSNSDPRETEDNEENDNEDDEKKEITVKGKTKGKTTTKTSNKKTTAKTTAKSKNKKTTPAEEEKEEEDEEEEEEEVEDEEEKEVKKTTKKSQSTAKSLATTTNVAVTAAPAAIPAPQPTTVTTKAAVVTPAPTQAATAAAAPPAAPDMSSLLGGLPAGMSMSMLGSMMAPKSTVPPTTRRDPGEIGAELGFDME